MYMNKSTTIQFLAYQRNTCMHNAAIAPHKQKLWIESLTWISSGKQKPYATDRIN